MLTQDDIQQLQQLIKNADFYQTYLQNGLIEASQRHEHSFALLAKNDTITKSSEIKELFIFLMMMDAYIDTLKNKPPCQTQIKLKIENIKNSLSLQKDMSDVLILHALLHGDEDSLKDQFAKIPSQPNMSLDETKKDQIKRVLPKCHPFPVDTFIKLKKINNGELKKIVSSSIDEYMAFKKQLTAKNIQKACTDPTKNIEFIQSCVEYAINMCLENNADNLVPSIAITLSPFHQQIKPIDNQRFSSIMNGMSGQTQCQLTNFFAALIIISDGATKQTYSVINTTINNTEISTVTPSKNIGKNITNIGMIAGALIILSTLTRIATNMTVDSEKLPISHAFPDNSAIPGELFALVSIAAILLTAGSYLAKQMISPIKQSDGTYLATPTMNQFKKAHAPYHQSAYATLGVSALLFFAMAGLMVWSQANSDQLSTQKIMAGLLSFLAGLYAVGVAATPRVVDQRRTPAGTSLG